MKRYALVLLLAGSGQRLNLGYNKIFYEINGIPIVALSAKRFFEDSNCQQIIYVGKEEELPQLKEMIQKYHLHDKRCQYVVGGSERQYSVFNGLQRVTEDIVYIHDGARPFISSQLISNLYDAASTTGAAVPGYPVKDTIKVVRDCQVVHTLNRSSLYQVQTPQVIQTKLIKEAHQQALKDHQLFTDDVSLIEHYGLSLVTVVESSPENIKVTTPIDLILAKELYQKYF